MTNDGGTFEELLSAVRGRVDERLRHWLEPRVASASRISAEVGMAAESVAELALRGGKRVRAALVVAGYEAFRSRGGVDSSAASWVACEPALIAVELLQVYLLIHDDWMDGDAVRRGGPAVHVKLRKRLGSHALGDAAAILAGDLASGFAQEALLETDLPAPNLLRAAREFARIQCEVVTGQLADMHAARPGPVDTHSGTRRPPPAGPSVETVHALKTASYTVTGPVLLGATLAGTDDHRCSALERFGRPLGIAFQLRDDLLGVFGDPSATGKPVWNDIRQGKRTALVAELCGDPVAQPLLARAHGREDATDADVLALVRRMEESGARARVEARTRELSEEARAALAELAPAMSERSHRWLSGAVRALGERTS